jgi:hypothetical protein
MTTPTPTAQDLEREQLPDLRCDETKFWHAQIDKREEEILTQSAELAALRAQVDGLRAALKGLYDMYTHAWDLADGSGLVMLADSIPRFESAHSAAHLALGYPPLVTVEDIEAADAALAPPDAGVDSGQE